jgi:hypothetical protein
VPLQALSPFVAFLPLARRAPTVIRAYLEMAADDFAREQGSTEALCTALRKSALFHQPPRGAFSMHDGVIDRRLRRLSLPAVSVLNRVVVVVLIAGSCSLLWTLLMIR